MKKHLSVLIALLLFTGVVAQKNLTIEETVLNRSKLTPAGMRQLQWRADMNAYTWVTNISATEEALVSATGGKTEKYSTLITLTELNEKIKSSQLTALAPQKTFPFIQWKDAYTFTFQANDYIVTYSLKSKTLQAKFAGTRDASASHFDMAPDGKNEAYTVGNNLYLSNNGTVVQVTKELNPGIVCGQSVHREEFGIDKGTFWAPNSQLLAFYRMDQTMVTEYPIIEIDAKPATARMIRYPMAGDSSHHVTVGVYNVVTGKTIYLKTGEPAEQYLTNISWSPDCKQIYIAVLNRGQNHLKFNCYNAETGDFIKTLFEEKSDKWVQPLHTMQFVPGQPDKFIWQSERDGYNSIYLYKTDGTLITQLSPTQVTKLIPVLIVTDVYGFDPKGTKLYYQAASIGNCNRVVFSVDVKTGAFSSKALTPWNGVSHAIFSKDFSQFICSYSDVNTPKVISHIETKAGKSTEMYRAENPLKDYNQCKIELFTITAADGETPLWCRMIYPANFDSTKKYPSLTYVYNGPNVQLILNSWMGGSDLFLYYMAQQGYVVFTVDGRGSANRGRDFAQAIYQHLGTQEIADQKKGSDFLKSKSYIDPKRMAVYGWSYGGFMTTSMMTRTPDVYRCGVAGGPVIDWKYYEIMYTERYMDTPQENPIGYKESSTLNYVDQLRGKLLLIHGTSDDVVVWQHSIAYTKEAVSKGVQTDYYIYPGHLHNVFGRDRVHLLTKIAGYIMENTK